MKIRILIVALFFTAAGAFAQDKEDDRLKNSYTVLKEILAMPDKGIPRDLLNKSSYGRGVITCRTGEGHNGPWSAPAMFALEGGSFGLQIGGQATDFVLLVMNDSGANSVLSSKVKLGADASVAAGPVGRDASAETDIVMKAEILSYSRARGVFAGVSLEGSTMRSDDGANKVLYGKELSAKRIVQGGAVKIPAAGLSLIHLLDKVSPRHTK
jgi:lipid-binding SYLF domain-containing protein